MMVRSVKLSAAMSVRKMSQNGFHIFRITDCFSGFEKNHIVRYDIFSHILVKDIKNC